MEPTWLDVKGVARLNKAAVGPGNHGRNLGSDLEAVLQRPKNTYHYGGERNLIALAATYGVAVTKAHAFTDGNKRTALLSVDAFLNQNGIEFDFSSSQMEGAQVFKDLASGKIGSEKLTKWLRKYIGPSPKAFSRVTDNYHREMTMASIKKLIESQK